MGLRHQSINSKTPMVSVIMSVYNGAQHLAESIDSILAQSFSDFEFVIVNDGSSDKTQEIIELYAHQDSRILPIHQKNIGLTKSLNIAIKKAKGKYIARMDADDISFKERFKKQVDFLENNNDYHLVGSNAIDIDEQGKEIRYRILEKDWDVIKKNFVKKNFFLHPSVLIDKKALFDIGLYNEEIKYGQDYELWLRFIKKYKGTNIQEFLIKKRITLESIGRKKRRERMFLFNKLILRSMITNKNISVSLLYLLMINLVQALIPDFFWTRLRRIKNSFTKPVK
jgi:hypothetical protein